MNFRQIFYFFALLGGCALTANGALIYGTIKAGNAPVANCPVEIACGGDPARARTNEQGSYSLQPNEKGSCTLTLVYKGEHLSIRVFSRDKPARYDLRVVSRNGSYRLEKQ